MCSITKPPRGRQAKPEPAHWALRPSAQNPFGFVRLSGARKSATYRVALLPADYGVGLEVAEETASGSADPYHVHLDPDGGVSCECLGFLRWGHCKHSQGLWDMFAAGDLDCLLTPRGGEGVRHVA
jgi:hypothetical protein